MEQPIPQLRERLTEEEYLKFESESPHRHEFRDGKIVDMAGGSWEHGRIALNFLSFLSGRLRGKRCSPVGSDVGVRIDKVGHYSYPDGMIVCGQPEFASPNSRTIITNPPVVIEVLSPSTELDDHVKKFSDYRSIDSVQEYVIVSQDKPQVETYYRQPEGIWAIGPTITGLDKAVRLRSIELEIPLGEIYAEIEFPKLSSQVEGDLDSPT